MTETSHKSVYVKLITSMFFWAGGFIAGRVVINHLSAEESAFYRFLIATSMFYLICLYKRIDLKLKHTEVFPLVALGATGISLYNIFFFGALETTEAARASIIIGSNPILVLVGSVLLFGESLGLKKIAGVLVSVFGAFYVLSNGNISPDFFTKSGEGDLYLIGAMFSWSAYSLIAKKYNVVIDPLKLQFYSGLFGTMMLLPFVLYTKDSSPGAEFLSTEVIGSLFYLAAFPTVLGFYWFVNAISALGASKASQFINLVPVFTVVLASLLLGEYPDSSLYLGGSLVILGLFLTRRA